MSAELEFKPNLEQSVERMRRFWNHEPPLDRPPAIITLPRPPRATGDGAFFGRREEYLAWQEEVFHNQMRVPDDQVPCVYPQYGHALISALCGGSIKVANNTVWSIPFLRDSAEAETLALDWNNEWGRRYREDLDVMMKWSEGRCAVANYETEGVSDTMSALRGATEVITEMMADPEGAERFASKVTGLLIKFGQWQNEHVGARQSLIGGETTGWRIWMPRGSGCFTEDHSVMLSRRQYRDFLARHDERLSAAFSKTILEVHKEGNHQIAEFGRIPGVSLLTIERFPALSAEHVEDIKRLIGRKVFKINARREELEDIFQTFGPNGVLFSLPASSVKEAHEILDNLKRLADRHRVDSNQIDR